MRSPQISLARVAALAFIPLLIVCCAPVQTGYYRFNQDPYSELFIDLLNDVCDEPMVGGNYVELLVNGVEILPGMLEAIENAEHSVNLESYIIYDDEVGHQFAEALIRKAEQGVAVRLMFDYFGGKLSDPWIEALKRAGVEVVNFNPFHWYAMLKGDFRTHRKLMVIDGRIGFAGGVCLANEWRGDADAPDHWRDTHVRVEGPVVHQMQDLFWRNWTRAGKLSDYSEDYYPYIPPKGDMLCGVVGRFEQGRGSRIREMFLLPLAASQENYWASIAYFTPDYDVISAFSDAVDRGVDIRFIVPGEANDLPMVRRLSMKYYGRMLKEGVRIFEYQGTNMHAKTVTCDGVWSTVGSSNMNNRAFVHNAENNLVIYDEEFALQMEQLYRLDLARSREISLAEWKTRPLRKRFYEQIWGILEGWM
ncbi:MAG: phospholipase D-like domain-containing protein [Candidatus Alcyoniella australis]|nr:phospholipase D-like domain-containing protein [Candidatus Alcyoniella australis]